MAHLLKPFTAEFFGTFVLVFVGCGSAILAGEMIGNLGVALAFGFSLLVMAYTIGPISGCHINPAVSLSFLLTRKMGLTDFCFYIVAQLLGAFLASAVLFAIATSNANFDLAAGLATNGFAERSPEGYQFLGAVLVEIIGTAILVFAVLRTTIAKFPVDTIGFTVGLALTIGLLVAIPVTNGSLNPARSFGVAIIEGGEALSQLWFFFAMPFSGAVLGSVLHLVLGERIEDNDLTK